MEETNLLTRLEKVGECVKQHEYISSHRYFSERLQILIKNFSYIYPTPKYSDKQYQSDIEDLFLIIKIEISNKDKDKDKIM